MLEQWFDKRQALMLGRRWGKTNMTMNWIKMMQEAAGAGAGLSVATDQPDWRNDLTAEEDDKVDDILNFVDSFGLESLGTGSLVAIVYKLIDALDDKATDDQPTKVDGSSANPDKPEATISFGVSPDRIMQQPYSDEQLERIRVLAATAKLRRTNVLGTPGYIAENAEAVELMRDYDFRLTKLVYMVQALQKEKAAQKQAGADLIRAAAHGATLMPYDTTERAKLLYAEYSKSIVGASWAGLSLNQREGWMRVARMWK